MKHIKVYLWIMVSLLVSSSVCSQIEKQTGLVIAQQADQLDNGWISASMSVAMTLRNKSGQETVRNLHNKILEVENDGDKSMVVFDNPVDVKGTASLVFTHKSGDDDQWLYLPAVRQVKRISSSNKSGPFMGSEFAYEDMASQEVEKYTYKYVGVSKANGFESLLVERCPVARNSGYKRQQVWYNKENYRIEKIDYYDRKNALIKTLIYNGYKLYNKKFWRPDEMTMKNHQTAKQTHLKFSDYQFNIGLEEKDFTQNSLRNAR
jgi:outer membrane lipoprotein-sorting protein